MYKCLIVDDEPIILKGIASKIRKSSSGFLKLFEALRGDDALEIIEREKPQIVITDVCMNDMSGLELINIVKQRGYNVKFIVISGYAEFDYLKEAIDMGATQYLLKPISNEKLNEVINKTIGLIEKEKNIKKIEIQIDELLKEREKITTEQIINELLFNDLEDEMYANHLESINSSINDKFILGILHISKIKSVDNNKLKDIKSSLKNIILGIDTHNHIAISQRNISKGDILLLFHGKDKYELQSYSDRVLKDLLDTVINKLQLEVTIGVSNIFDKIDNKIYRQALRTVNNRIGDMTCKIYHYTENNYDNMEYYQVEKLKLLEKYLIKKDTAGINDVVESLFLTIKNKKENQKIKEVYLNIINTIYNFFLKENFKIDSVSWSMVFSDEILKHCDKIEDVTEYIRKIIDAIFKDNNIMAANSRKEYVKHAIRFINNNYATGLTLEMIANELSLNPQYFSTIFKKETGHTVVEEIKNVRIEKATSLLLSTKSSAYEIAMSVGYQDPTYFYKVFKKHMGLTPKEYRKRESHNG